MKAKTADEFLRSKPLRLSKDIFEGYTMSYSHLRSLLDEYASQVCQSEIDGYKLLVEAMEEYEKLCTEELNELAVLASNRGWKSKRVEEGEKMRNRINELKHDLNLKTNVGV